MTAWDPFLVCHGKRDASVRKASSTARLLSAQSLARRMAALSERRVRIAEEIAAVEASEAERRARAREDALLGQEAEVRGQRKCTEEKEWTDGAAGQEPKVMPQEKRKGQRVSRLRWLM